MKIHRLNTAALFGDDNSPAIATFIEQFGEVLYAGKGVPAAMLKQLGIGADFAMRCMVGIPDAEFSREKRVLAEAYCEHLAGCSNRASVWINDGAWQPKNAKRRETRLEQSCFDVQWALSLGLNQSRWESDVLLSPGIFSRQAGRQIASNGFGQNARLLLALSVYGFSDPWQFFTAST